jgi:hypothetical protein
MDDGKIHLRQTPDDLLHELTFGLGEHRDTLRYIARRAKWQWEPSQEDCRRIAADLIARMKRAGLVQVVRAVSPPHGGASVGAVPTALPLWRPASLR